MPRRSPGAQGNKAREASRRLPALVPPGPERGSKHARHERHEAAGRTRTRNHSHLKRVGLRLRSPRATEGRRGAHPGRGFCGWLAGAAASGQEPAPRSDPANGFSFWEATTPIDLSFPVGVGSLGGVSLVSNLELKASPLSTLPSPSACTLVARLAARLVPGGVLGSTR